MQSTLKTLIALALLAALPSPLSARGIPLSDPAKSLIAAGASFSRDYNDNAMAFLTFDDKWNGTPDDLKHLADLDFTYAVRLHGDKAADAVLPLLHKTGDLESLQIDGLSLTKQQSTHIAALKIPSLRITKPNTQHLKLANAHVFKQIEIERLRSTSLELDSLPHLESLTIHGESQRATKSLALTLQNLPKLKKLKITESAIDTLPLATFPQLEEFTLYSVTVPDAFLQQLGDLKHLTAVNIHYRKNSDLALAALAGSHLKHLNIDGPATDDAFLKVKDLSQLESLSLQGPAITHRSLARIEQATGLKRLRIPLAHLSAATFGLLARLTALDSLDLAEAVFLPADLKSIANLPNLENLYLTGTATDDAAVAHLASLPKLRDVSLRQTAITDTALTHLANIKSLRDLDVRGTKVTAQAVKSLKAARPNLRIASEFGFN